MKIHFVWLGPNQGAHCTNTPLAVAQQCPEDQVWLWVLEQYRPQFLFPLSDSHVRIKVLDLDSEVQQLTAPSGIKDAFKVIRTLIHHKAWAGAKDLAVLLILYKYGGLYFDSTCMLATKDECKQYESKRLYGIKARSLPDAVKALAKSTGPALPLVKDDNVDYQPGAYSVKALNVGYDESLEGKYPILNMPHIDVWAYFSPVSHTMFLWAAESYIGRATFLGLNEVDLEGAGKKILEAGGGGRDDLVGHLIIASIFDGLTRHLGTTDSETIKRICWRGSSFKGRPTNLPPGGDGSEGNFDILPEMGIIKQYKNTHRSEK